MPRRWLSDLPTRLAKQEGTSTPEQAVVQMADRKLRVLELLSPPVDLAMVASVCGIQPEFTTAEMKQDARLVVIDDRYHVQVNPAHDERRHRFSVAHEITHKIIADATGGLLTVHSQRGFSYLIQNRDLEELCNVGARQILLLTPERLQPLMRSQGFSRSAVSEIESLYEVSFEAAARSLAETALDKVAVVYFVMGYRKDEEVKVNQLSLWPDWVDQPESRLRVTRYYKSGTFDITIPWNKSIPAESWITEAFDTGQPRRATEVLTFNDRHYYQFDVEAMPRAVYVDGAPREGMVLLLSNPVQQSSFV